MPVWPKSFHTFGMSLRTAATEWKLRQHRAAVPAQEAALKNLLPRLAATSFWRPVGVDSGMTYEQFRTRVPLHTHERLAPALEAMQRGEADVLWPGRCTVFARTAGTSTGKPRLVPMSDELLAHFSRGGAEAALYYTVRARNAGVFRGRHLLLGAPPVLVPLGDPSPNDLFAADASGIAALGLPAWVDRHLYEPGLAAAQHADWNTRLDAIAGRTRSRDISLIAGLPTWLLVLAQAQRDRGESPGRNPGALQTLWPNLECCVHTGLQPAPYLEQLRATLGTEVTFHEVYAATEAFVATQDGDARAGLRLMADLGVFFEFLPLADFDETRLEQLGARALPLAGVKPGVDYVLVVTTPGGLVRHVIGDVVRFTSIKPPRLIHVGGTTLRLNAFGENVSERDATDVLASLCQRHQWSLVNFHIAPRFAANAMTGQRRGQHEWWIELKPGTVATPTGPQIASELDPDLLRAHEGYAARRKSGMLDGPVVRLVMPGIFEHWLRFHQHWDHQHKVPRCRSDRLVADELAQITNFAPD